MVTRNRAWLATATALLLVPFVCSGAAAQDKYPSRIVHVIVPTPAGGPVDVMARLVANQISPGLGQNVIIDNRGGAGNTIGSAEAARATADGYTLLYSSSSGLVIAPMLQKSAGYDPLKSYDPIAAVAATANILVVHPSVPAKSVGELIALAKRKPSALNYGSAEPASLAHLAGALFATATDISLTHVPYKSSAQSVVDLISGRLDMQFATIAPTLSNIRAGR
jgi:tripartite-type tricarboxylate transporter receptor subunit TctC